MGMEQVPLQLLSDNFIRWKFEIFVGTIKLRFLCCNGKERTSIFLVR